MDVISLRTYMYEDRKSMENVESMLVDMRKEYFLLMSTTKCLLNVIRMRVGN